MLDLLLWPIQTMINTLGWAASLALWVAPFWAAGSIALLPQSAWKRTGRSKWGWLGAAAVGLFLPLVGVANAVIYAIGPRSPVKREAAHLDALGR